MKITAKQRKLYRWQVAELNRLTGHYDEAARRDLLEKVTRSRSSKDLTAAQMKAVIDEQKRLLNQSHERYHQPRGASRRTWTQDGFLQLLLAQVGWKDDEARIMGFAKHTLHDDTPMAQWTTAQKTRLITALKKVRASMRTGTMKRNRPQTARRQSPEVTQTEATPDAESGSSWSPSFIKGGMTA